ncbi:hypothetical protein [Streptomyces sp. NPDC048332]|uniref:hypothetical protein n=1 Tax=unclassified Streptomyces TaxID=2593676 RepID=UPI003434D71D
MTTWRDGRELWLVPRPPGSLPVLAPDPSEGPRGRFRRAVPNAVVQGLPRRVAMGRARSGRPARTV